MVYDKVKFYRDLAFMDIQYSDKFKSKQNPDINLGEAYVNRDLIRGISGASNQYPKGLDRGLYDFIKTQDNKQQDTLDIRNVIFS